MRVEYHPTGIFLPDLDLWLDSRRPVKSNWISHAHADHASGGHGHIFASAETIRFLRIRDLSAGDTPTFVAPDEQWFHLPGSSARLQSIPCAHIVGARMLLVEHDGERFLYTGDFKLRESLLGSRTVLVSCDHLVMESTFGLPIYRFLSRELAQERIIRFAQKCLDRGEMPVFVGYALGRGQEIVHVLTNAGIPVAVHGAIARLIPAHEESGYRFPGWGPYSADTLDGKALVTVPGFQDVLERNSRNFRLAHVSGWARLDHSRTRMGADELIPYSDHADFQELLEFAAGTGAKQVDVVHGYTEAFARILRSRGIQATGIGSLATSPEEEEGPSS